MMRFTLLAMFAIGAFGQRATLPINSGIFYNASTVSVCLPNGKAIPVGSTAEVLTTTGEVISITERLKVASNCISVKLQADTFSLFQVRISSPTVAIATTDKFRLFPFPFEPVSGQDEQNSVSLKVRSRHVDVLPFPLLVDRADYVVLKALDANKVPLSTSDPLPVINYPSVAEFDFAVAAVKGAEYYAIEFVSGVTAIVTESAHGFKKDADGSWDPVVL